MHMEERPALESPLCAYLKMTFSKGVSDLIVNPGLINLDFAVPPLPAPPPSFLSPLFPLRLQDLATVTRGQGRAIMGTGEGIGANRAGDAAKAALENPLLGDVKLAQANGVLISITGGDDMTLFEVACNLPHAGPHTMHSPSGSQPWGRSTSLGGRADPHIRVPLAEHFLLVVSL
jgi:hypothetical protein